MSDVQGGAPAPSSAPEVIPGIDPAVSSEALDAAEADLEGDLDASVGEAPEAPKAEEAKKSAKKKYKLKVNGKEVEDEIDFDNDEDMVRRLQKAKAFEQTSQEMAAMKKQVNQLVETLKSNPAKVLADLGLSMDDLAEGHIQRMIEEAKKSPEQIEREKMQKELEEMRAEREALKKQQEDAELEAMRNQHAQEIESQITQAIEAAGTVLPKQNPWVMREIGKAMLFAMQNGYPNVQAKDVIPYVEQQFMGDLKAMFDVFPEEVLERVVGKNNFDRVRKKRIKSQKSTESARQSLVDTAKKKSTEDDPKPTKSFSKFFTYLDE